MAKKKLPRFAENETFKHLFQYAYEELSNNGFPLKGKWRREYFKNENPVILELGCGKGEYTTGLSKRYPEKNYIGVDIKGARLWRGCKTVEEEKLSNTAFIRTRINLISFFFDKNEVDEIWITFPDPQLQKSRERKRLTSPWFLKLYKGILKPNACIHLKTDSKQLYDYTLEVIKKFNHNLIENKEDIYNYEINNELTEIQTFYEQMWLEQNIPINYIKFQLT